MDFDFDKTLGFLQHSDSFFPSGAVSFSYGLEGLRNDGRVSKEEQLERFLLEQLVHRWATIDRGIIAAVYHASYDLEQIEYYDSLLEAMTLPKELRLGSRRAGKALQSMHTRLGSEKVIAYSEQINDKPDRGHLTVIQTLAWSDAGMSLQQCCAMSAHIFCVGILGAAVRLSIIGHISAQQILVSVRERLTEVLETEIPPVEELSTFTPVSEVASMRHEYQLCRLFAN